MEKRSAWSWVMGGCLVLLCLFSIHLAQNRIYQVDEGTNIFMARIIGTGQSARYFTHAPLWLMGPLAWLARSAQASVSLFEWGRFIFIALFWVNVFLIALNTGIRLRSAQGLLVLVTAATLAPVWDYGFEIRHDNLLLTGVLLFWWLGRVHPLGLGSYALLGLLSVVLQFVTFKAFLYTLPLSGALLLFPHPSQIHSRFRLAVAWMSGLLAAFLLCRIVYGVAGLWPVFVSGISNALGVSGGGYRFGPGISLERVLTQTPLLLAVTCAALFGLGQEIRRRGREALAWDGAAPEAVLFLITLAAFLANPTPFPYNLVNLLPFALILSIRFLQPIMRELQARPALIAVAVGIFLFSHLVPFALATRRHLDMGNQRQKALMRAAEAFTDPAKDMVWDAVGMVPTRHSIDYRWYLHSLNLHLFTDGTLPGVPEILTAMPAAVIMPNYRTDWLPEADWAFIQGRYIPLADDFWVLGQMLPPGGGEYTVVHPGRYQVVGQRERHEVSVQDGMLDGRPIGAEPMELSLGPHHLSCAPEISPALVWVGPRLKRLPALGRGDRLKLFVNWY